MRLRTAVLVAVLPLVWGCAAAGARQGEPGPRRDPWVITAAELLTANAANLYDAILQLRPMWLNRRVPGSDPRSGAPLPVFIERARFGTSDDLRSLRVVDVLAVRLLSPSQAMGDFQRDEMLGAIEVVLRVHR